MNAKERILKVLRNLSPDRVPWTIYPELLPRGSMERKVREMGCALAIKETIYIEEKQHTKIEEEESMENRRKVVKKTYNTPVGSVYEKKVAETEYQESLAWIKEYMIKSPSDYPVVKFIIQNTIYHPNYDRLLRIKEFLGNDGIIIGWVDYPPLQKLLIHIMGIERFYLDLYDRPAEVEDLLKTIENKQNEMYQIAAEAPVQIIRCASNVTSEVTPPHLFEKYLLPFYNKQASLLHKKKKLYGAHMDGKLKSLANLIAKTNIDIVEGFTPPPIGDLSLSEARNLWGNKIIWANFPTSLLWEGKEKIMYYLKKMLREVAPGNNFIFGITEDIPYKIWKESLEAIALGMSKYGSYPINLPQH